MVFPGLCPIFQEEEEILTKRKYKDCWKVVFFFSYAEKSEQKNMLILASYNKSCSYPFI